MSHRLPLALFIALACACPGLVAVETSPSGGAPPIDQWFDWSTTAKSASYDTVRADLPLYEDATLWPLLEKNEAYYNETWPKARLLIWAQPGENGDWHAAASWTEDGKPATKGPDKDTDVLLPAAEKKYLVGNPPGIIECRHITLEKGAAIMGGDSRSFDLYGNAWVKIGANLNINLTIPRGAKQTFLRNDHPLIRNAMGHPCGGEGNVDGHYIGVNKEPTGSVEYLGVHHALDKLFLHSGTTIVGPDSCLISGGWNRPVVEPAATLILMSGAYTGQREFNDGRYCEDSLRVDGKMLAGTKERPLVRDAVLSLNYKDVETFSSARGLIVTPGGSIEVQSKDPQKARLVMRWSGVEESLNDPKDLGLIPGADVPRRICMNLLGKIDFDGVLFIDVDKGGIQLADLTQKDAWRHVFFGGNCGAVPEGLYAKVTVRTVAKKTKPEAKPDAKPQSKSDKVTTNTPLFESQVWAPTRLLTWAKPGQGGDPEVAANWLENGKPATVSADRSCDLLLPEAAQPYTVGGDKLFNVSARHLTVGKNARLESRQIIAFGNVWAKEGGSIRARVGIILKGISHTFVRNDNPGTGDTKGPGLWPNKNLFVPNDKTATNANAPGLWLSSLDIRKGYVGDGSTVELLGHINIANYLRFFDPTANNCMRQVGCDALVIGSDALVEFGNIGNGLEGNMGVIQLMSGSVFQRNQNVFPEDGVDFTTGTWHKMTLMAGTPERPLTKDAVLGLSAVEDDHKQTFGLLLRSGNHISVASADPTKARLVIRWHGHGSEALTKRGGVPRIRVGLFGDCQFDGVLFDQLADGGLVLPKATLPAEWKHVSFGPGGAEAAKALVAGTQPPKR